MAWRQTLGGTAEQHAKLEAVIEWLDVFHKQCHNVALPSTANLQKTKLPHAREVLLWQLQVERFAEQEHATDIKRFGKMHRHATAVASQEAAMMAMMFGYLPPLRLACVRSLLHPDQVLASGGCMDEDCRCVISICFLTASCTKAAHHRNVRCTLTVVCA